MISRFIFFFHISGFPYEIDISDIACGFTSTDQFKLHIAWLQKARKSGDHALVMANSQRLTIF